MVLAVIAGIYAAVMVLPLVADNWDVINAIDAAYNDSGRSDDGRLRAKIMEQLRYVGEHEVEDPYGGPTKVELGLGLTPEQIVIDRNEVTGDILIEIDYQRKLQLKPTDKIIYIAFHPQKSGPIPK